MQPRAGALFHAILAAVCVAHVGGVLLAAGELGLVWRSVARQLAGTELPGWLLLAAFGRAAVTHVLFWIALLTPCALVYAALARRRPRASPLPILTAIWILAVGFLVLPADLELGGRARPAYLYGGWLAAVVLAAAAFVVLRRIFARAPLRRLKIVGAATLPAFAILLVGAAALARSPLHNAAEYRVAAARPLSGTPSPQSPPNVLWIVLDTARADRMSCYGHSRPTTPFLDELARSSLLFERAIADGMWTVPAHASMFTGRSLREHGADHRHLWLDDAFRTVAETLAERGYATACLSNNPLVAPHTNLTQGFTTRTNVHHLRQLTRFSLDYLGEKWGLARLPGWLDGDYGAALTNRLVADWLDRAADGPVFVFINYMETHLPYRVPRRCRELFLTPAQVDRSYALRHRVYGNLLSRFDRDYCLASTPVAAPSDEEILRGQYDAAVRYLDDRVREAVGLFERSGRLANTLLIVCSDHGEYLGGHGMWGHRFLAYQDLIHAALLVRAPGGTQAARIKTPVLLSDLYGLVLDAVGAGDEGGAASAPRGRRGTGETAGLYVRPGERTLPLSHEIGPPAEPAIVVSACGGPDADTLRRFEAVRDPRVLHRSSAQFAALDGRYKYIRSADGLRELFDLDADPDELRNLIDAEPDAARRLDELLGAWLAAVPAYQPPADRTRSGDVDRALRSLGYVGDDE